MAASSPADPHDSAPTRAPRGISWLIRAVYDWTLGLARARQAPWLLGLVAFVESSFFPVPPDVMLAPMVLADRRRWLRYAAICTAGSVLGALLGYAIGYWFWEAVGQPILAFYGKEAAFDGVRESYNSEWGLLAVLAGAVTFLPYKVFTIFSGVTGLNVAMFVAVSVFGRGLRFFAVAWAVARWGAPIQGWIEKRLTLVFFVALALLVAGFAAFRFVL